MKRRDFIKCGMGGLGALVVGSKLSWLMDNPAYASSLNTTGVINLVATDALKQMVTWNPGHPATCYFWIFQDDPAGVNPLPPECPGPIIFATSGDIITVNLTNNLDAPHAFSIPRMRVTTGPIAPGATKSVTFHAGPAGTYLYYDDLNAPVNRVMGLHGAFIVMPRQLQGTRAQGSHRLTPYDNPTPNVQRLFDDLGHAPWWPGLAWEEGDPLTDTPPYRQNIWVLHQASPNLFTQVGNNATISFTTTEGESVTGSSRDPVVFTKAFLNDSLNPLNPAVNGFPTNFVPQYFTISGQSGHFSHNTPWICPYSRVGEPYLIRILNAGMWLHSTHIHANHVFVLQHNNRTDPVPGSFDNPIWIDVYTANPLDTYDWLIPYMRPPDVPNNLGIGRDDLETSLDVSGTAVTMPNYGILTDASGAAIGPPWTPVTIPVNPDPPFFGNPVPGEHLTWPPVQELNTFIPNVGGGATGRLTLAQDGVTQIDCAVRLSPICFPMHDHSEPSQVANGGNYNCGMISGIIFTGDRKGRRPGQPGVLTFPDRPTTGDPATPVAHGPDIRPGQKGALTPSPPFIMPSVP